MDFDLLEFTKEIGEDWKNTPLSEGEITCHLWPVHSVFQP